MDEEKPKAEKQSGPSTRFVLVAGGVAVLLVFLAVLTATLWPEIQLRYYRRRFRRGTAEQQQGALEWICENRLRRDMDRVMVERVLGEPLENRFTRHPLGAFLDPDAPVSVSVPAVVFSFADTNLDDGAYGLCFSADEKAWVSKRYLYAMHGYHDDGHFLRSAWGP